MLCNAIFHGQVHLLLYPHQAVIELLELLVLRETDGLLQLLIVYGGHVGPLGEFLS